MADQPIRKCLRCGHTHIGAPLAPAGLATLHVCPLCGTFALVRELGEMAARDDRADDSWGGVGWQ